MYDNQKMFVLIGLVVAFVMIAVWEMLVAFFELTIGGNQDE